MATSPDALTRDIATTRGRMDQTLDDLGERAGPGRLKQRMRMAVENTRDTVMGVAGDTRDRAAESGAEAADTVRRQSQGNPVAAGLIAFGAGLLAGSVLPETRTEHRVARDVQRRTQGRLREEMERSGSALSDRVGGRAEEAKDRLAEEGRHARDDVASDARGRAREVRDHAEDAAEDVRQDVKDEARRQSGG